MNPFNHIQRAKDHEKRKEKFIYTPCVVCIRPDPLAYPHAHMQAKLIPVSSNIHYEAQLRLLANRENQDAALQMISTEACNLLCFNDPISLESLKRVTPPSEWYRKLEEGVQYYDSVGENAPHCTLMSEEHKENCSISCTQVGRTTQTIGDYSIRYIKLWITHAPVAYAFPVIVVPLEKRCFAYVRIISNEQPPENLNNVGAKLEINNDPQADKKHEITEIKKRQLMKFLPKEEITKDEQMVYSNLDKILNEILGSNLYAAKITITETANDDKMLMST